MSRFPLRGRTLALIAAIVPLLILFIYVGLRSGPLALVAVTVTSVTSEAVSPALFGIGTVEARHTHKIGPIFAGRIQRLDVQVGDQVKAGQVLGEMDPVDLEDRGRSLEAAVRRAEAVLRSMVLLGVQEVQLEAVSFGEERPALPGSDEAAWAKNRRVDLRDK